MDLTSSNCQTELSSSTSTGSTVPQRTSSAALSEIKPPELDDGELGQVQELLFGNQLHVISNHLKTLQLHIEQQFALIREDYAAQLASLQKRIDAEFSVHAQKQRNNEIDVSDKLKKTENRLNELDVHLSSQISEIGTRLTNDIVSNNIVIQQRVDDAVRQLNDQKMDRDALSNLLGDVASQLANNSKQTLQTKAKVLTKRTGKKAIAREKN